jgi:hypothetical protein
MALALRIETVDTRPAAPVRRLRQPRARQLRLLDPLLARPAAEAHAGSAPPAVPVAGPGPALHPLALVRAAIGAVADLETLPVAGAGMPDALLAAGDTVILQPAAGIVDGALHAVTWPGQVEPVLRRLFQTDRGLRLQPENRACPAEERPAAEVRVAGRVVAVVRRRDGQGETTPEPAR